MLIKIKKLFLAASLLLICAPALAAYADTSTISVYNFNNGGTITSSTGGLNCSSSHCDFSWTRTAGTGITFHATAKSGRVLKEFRANQGSNGANLCAEPTTSTTCTVSNGDNLSQVYADWVYSSYKFSITAQGSGSGSFTVSAGSSCGTNCWQGYSDGQSFTVTAHPASGSVFSGWETSGEQCYAMSGAGKSGSPIRNTSSTCSATILSQYQTNTAVATFSKATAASSSSSSTSSTSTSSSTTSSGAVSSTSSASTDSTSMLPAAPKIETIKIDGQTVNDKKPIQIATDQPLVLSGKTVPNGVVTLTIHSKTRTVKITADKKGNWKYAISGLPAGNHYVEAAVTDPATKKTSPVGKLLSFKVTAAKNATTNSTNKVASAGTSGKKSSLAPFMVIILLLIIAGGGWYIWQRKRAPKTPLQL